jgi:putative transposase
MTHEPAKHKTIKRYHESGDFHELSFSCYQRLPLLMNDDWCGMLAQAIDLALERWMFQLHAFVFMPEHLHLLVLPLESSRIDMLLKAIKRPFSYRIKKFLEASSSDLLQKLTIVERPGKSVFRFWQEGPGYDRNLNSEAAVLAAIDYIHRNPVRRGLCAREDQWKWSSARFFMSDGQHIDPDLPRISRLPAEFFS